MSVVASGVKLDRAAAGTFTIQCRVGLSSLPRLLGARASRCLFAHFEVLGGLLGLLESGLAYLILGEGGTTFTTACRVLYVVGGGRLNDPCGVRAGLWGR